MTDEAYPPAFVERFWAKVEKGGGCWLWTGARYTNGYGYVHVRRDGKATTTGAHRVAYELTVGPIPEERQLDHLCRNRACVNPEHLEPVTHRENDLRGRGVSATNAVKTHCPQGHPLSGENLYTSPKGRRQCRACRRRHAQRMDTRRREQRARESAADPRA